MKKRDRNFNSLLQNLELQECTDEVLGYQCDYKTFHLAFYADAESNFSVIVDDFYYLDKKGNYQSLTASKEQLKKLQEIITNKVIDYANEIEDATQHECNICGIDIDSYGLCKSQACFEADNR